MTESRGRTRARSAGLTWPAIPSPRSALLLALAWQIERSQWWTAERLLEDQLRQPGVLLRHAHATVPFHRRRFGATGFDPASELTLDAWRTLPLLTRRDVQEAGTALHSNAVPESHGRITETQTSGSTGEPLRVKRTDVDKLFWEAMTLRGHEWHTADYGARLAAIRIAGKGDGAPPDGTLYGDWGPPVSELCATGPSALLSLATDIPTQARWLMRQKPDCLVTYPTNLMALIRHFSDLGKRPRRLRSVRTVGETVSPELRTACREAWGVPVIDNYSSQELGYIAWQCPDSDRYHVMSESVFVEILDSAGRPCGPGEAGRVVVTSLHNFAMPLIRYEVGDHAEVADPCPCGRGLPTLGRILGRTRNMVIYPNGERHWPLVGLSHTVHVVAVRQFQLIQHTLEDIRCVS